MDRAAYEVDDKSVLHALYQRMFWDRITVRIPAAVTPNALTIIGHALGVLAAALCIVASEGNHRALYVASALAMMASLTLDEIDGEHARRTGQCSRRGELLDHGLDGVRSTAVLIMTGVLLQMGVVAMGVFCALGAFTFAAVFWEQLRTGALSLPKVGPIEGVTALVVWEVLVALFGEPSWLRFSTHAFTAGTAIVGAVVIAHGIAVVPPLVRASKRGISILEVAPLFAIVVLQLAFLLHGANTLVVVATMGLCCAHATCHFIVVRHVPESHAVLPSSLHLAALPLPLMLVDAEIGAAIALALAAAGYAHTLHRGWRLLGEPAP